MKRGQKGVSLLELLIAVLILAIVSGPIMLTIQNVSLQTAIARDTTIAAFTAQMRMEELIDLTSGELNAQCVNAEYNGFDVEVERFEVYGQDELAKVVVTVYNKSGREMCKLENILYVPS